MKHNKKNGGRSKPPGRRQNFNTPMNKSFAALSDDSSRTPSDQITMRPEMHAVRAAFNTPELLEAILLILYTKSLVYALTVSKYCRQVILGSVELRRILFLDPSPPTEFLELDETQTLKHRKEVLKITSNPSQYSRIIVKVHPTLKPEWDLGITLHFDWSKTRPSSSIYSLPLITMETMPPSTLLFQPSPAKVNISYSGYSFALQQKGGQTFGAMAQGLRDLRCQCQKEIEKLVKLPSTALNRKRYAYAKGVLDGPIREYDILFFVGQCILLEAEDSICDDHEDVWWAQRQEGLAPTGW